MTTSAKLPLAATCLSAVALSACVQVAAADQKCTGDGWATKSDAAFAADCADTAFNGSLEERQMLAWMFFTRVNQLIADPTKGGMSNTGKVPVWMAWPTDPDTFDTARPFDFKDTPRDDMSPTAEKKDLEAGGVATADPDGANEEVTRNRISYDYLIESGLTTKLDIAAFFEKNDYVDMPVGSVELKASWLQVTEGSPAPDGALTFNFDSGEYWWRGLHIMAKMQSLSDPSDVFYSEDPSWFWTTFEFTNNPGVAHVRDQLITQRAPLSEKEISAILETGGLAGFGLEAYAPNGTQIRFTAAGTGETPVILGHTDMEDFAGSPNTAQPRYWTRFEASCHSCHATASYNPEIEAFFPFSVPTGALHPGYNKADSSGAVRYLGQGYKPLDFMWPIAFQAR
ncbi:hypothetical protein [Denitrobaculum tricleocarpae]|uniref:Cytochrome c domain-containing protein n=1 Tax=Denitrobaculum tricleocarpae TaxID=2591009 RepID=A0A545TP40_9PROT|nr:hypothetical protein [Denitrobaculum tricleocarpae]TQV78989.1 hypothetical protein FKG95_14995 [Denitrobaculum tricleocarpae]